MIILVDQDGPLADFEGAFLQAWQQRYPERARISLEARTTFYVRDQYPKEFLEEIEEIHNAPGFTLDMSPVPGSIEALHAMTAAGHTVFICTSPLSGAKTSMTEKLEWIERYLGRAYVKRTICTKDKTLIRGDYLIDDKLEIGGLLSPTWKHILYTMPYNADVSRERRLTADWSNWATVCTS